MRTEQKNIHAGHRQRMLERFRKYGFDVFHPHEVLEILLFRSITRANTNPTGHYLIDRFGSVDNVLRADTAELVKISGVGPVSAEYIASVVPVVSRYMKRMYSEAEELSRQELAMLAYWFMRDKEKPIGVMFTGADGRFYDFINLPLCCGDDGIVDFGKMLSYAEDIPEGSFSLFTRERDLFSEDDIYEIRRVTFGMSLVLDEIYFLRRNEPIPTLHTNYDWTK